jgi:RHS repeat-associated protein
MQFTNDRLRSRLRPLCANRESRSRAGSITSSPVATIVNSSSARTTAYAYTEFSAIKKKTDARGVESHYAFDALHQVTQTWYTGLGGDDAGNTRPALPSPVATTSELALGYSSSGALSSVTLVTNNAYQYTENYAFDTQNRVSSLTRVIGDKTYATSYEYNQANQATKLTYPSGKQVILSYDDRARLNSAADQNLAPYANAMSYNVEARPTGLTLGNGVVKTNTFDPNRSQVASQTASKNGASLMNLSYSYDAAAGQSGAATTPGNSHQLVSLSGTINGTTESASYTYDLQHRLVTSAQSSNGVSAQRRFAYDRWGNRTGEWDAVSGGSQIQSVTLQQSGGAPTNRITSVTNSGATANYTYDAAGNVTNDGVHSYTYDAANRVVSVDGGATAQYAYDHQNRRVKKVAGGATTNYVWEGGKVIAEHDGTAVGPWTAKVDYVYARGVLIATRNYTIGQQCTTNKGVTTCTTVLQSTAIRYYVSDVWSTRLVLDASGTVIGRQAHLPFGEEFAASGTQEKHHFTSYEAESESGTDYAVNRQYPQSVGRFGSADPYQASSHLVNPQSWNRYSYVLNDPIHNVDPLGLFEGVAPEVLPDPCGLTPDPNPIETGPSCSIGINVDGPLSLADSLEFEYLPSAERRRTGPTDDAPFPHGPGWYYRVEIFGTVSADVSMWRIRQEVQTFFVAEYDDGSTARPIRDNDFRPDPPPAGIYQNPGSRVQQLPGQEGFFAIDAPGKDIRNDGKNIISMTLHMNFRTWAEFNVQGLGRLCAPIFWHVSIVIKNGKIKTLSAGLGHVNI